MCSYVLIYLSFYFFYFSIILIFWLFHFLFFLFFVLHDFRRSLSGRLVRLQEAESLLKSDEDEFNRQVDAFEEKVQQVTALGEKVKKQSEEVRERKLGQCTF